MMEVTSTVLLVLGAFLLGSCPFSVIIGRWFLGKDIRGYGDGNPGAANVFRAGGHKLGYLAVLLDITKGIPFVFLAHAVFELSNLAVVLVAIGAILGHAFSPFLRWRGGKAVAITFGVLIALPQHEALFAFAAFVILGVLLLDNNSWGMLFGASGALAFLAITGGSSWELVMMLAILAIFAVKHFQDLRTLPGFRGRLVRWLNR
jgi:glycerol-3-phosphate acyltransferase PlsY